MANWLLMMGPVILSESGGARDGWMVVVVRVRVAI